MTGVDSRSSESLDEFSKSEEEVEEDGGDE